MTNLKTRKETVEHVLMDTMEYYNSACLSEAEMYLEDEASESVTEEEREHASALIEKGDGYEATEFLNLNLEVDSYITQDYFDCEIESVKSILDTLIKRYEDRYKTEIVSLLLVSKRYSPYGSIGGNGSTGYRFINDTDLFSVNWHADDIRIAIEDGILKFTTYDHDGTSSAMVKLITRNMLDSAEEKYGSYDVDEHLFDLYHDKAAKFPQKWIDEIL